MRLSMLLIVASVAANAQTNEVVKVKVVGDRVSLRASPGTDGELLDRAMRGEEMVFFGKTNGWVAVQAPDSLDFWVAAEYIQNGVVVPEKLNVRSGPSLNYTVVAELGKGDAVGVRGEFNNWIKIAPPVGGRVWLSEDYVEIIEPPKPEPVVVAAPEPEPVPVKAEEPPEELKPLVLVMDDSKRQGVYDEMPGILRRANPGLFKLVYVVDGIEEPVCLVRGKESQLERYLNRSLLIKGPVYWAKGVSLPIIQPDKLHLDPIIAE